MTAPIIYHVSRTAMSEGNLRFIQERGTMFSTKSAQRRSMSRPEGQLWERLRWRDYVENGEPTPFQELHDRRAKRWLDPLEARHAIAGVLEIRRPEMRERRASKPCKSCDGRGWDFEVLPETDRPDGRVVCPDCWGSGKYVGSISEHADNGGEL